MAYQESPATHARAVTTSDTVALPDGVCRSIYVGGAGNLALKLGEDSTAVTFSTVLAGVVYPFRAQYVMATNTTATLIVALY